MSNFSALRCFLWLVFIIINVAAVQYGNQTTASSSSAGLQKSGPEAFTGDCRSYESSAIAKARTASSITSGTITAAPKVDFVEYWCENPHFPGNSDPEAHPEIISGWFQGLNASVKSYCFSLEEANYSSWATDTHRVGRPATWTPFVSSPCCNDYCDIKASAVELKYWPKTPAVQNVTTVVDETGFTFTYPSVYVVYKQLSASGDCGIIGPTFASLTKSYAPDAIATLVHSGAYGLASKLNYEDLWSNCTSRGPPETYTVCEKQSSGPCIHKFSYSNTLPDWEQIHCHPSIAYPKGLEQVDSAWSTCHPGNFASVFDPPRALTPASAMGGAKVTSVPSSIIATPAPVVTQEAPSITSSSSLIPIRESSGNDPSIPSKQESINNDPPAKETSSSQTSPSGANNTPKSSSAGSVAGIQSQDNAPGSGVDPKEPVKVQAQDGSTVPTKPAAGGDSVNFMPTPDTTSSEPANKNVPAASPSSTTVLGYAVQVPSSSGVVVVGGQSIVEGGGAVSVSGTLIATKYNGGVVIGSSTLDGFLPTSNTTPTSGIMGGTSTTPLPSTAAAQTMNVAGQSVAVLNDGNVIVGSTTLTSNAPAVTIAGLAMSVGNDRLFVGTSTIALPKSPLPSTVTIAGQTHDVSIAADGRIIDGTMVRLDQSAVRISGTPVSLGISGLTLGSSTISLQATTASPSSPGDIGGLIISGLGGFPAATIAVAQPTSTTHTTGTGRAFNGTEVFLGDGGQLLVEWSSLIIITAVIVIWGL